MCCNGGTSRICAVQYRLGRQRQFSPDAMTVTNEQFYKRGTSFHGFRQSHEPVHRTVMKSTLKVPSYRQ